MTDNFEYKSDKSDKNELNDICDECKKEDETCLLYTSDAADE